MKKEPSYEVSRNALSGYIRDLLKDNYIKERTSRKEKGRPDHMLSLTPKGKGALLRASTNNGRLVGKSFSPSIKNEINSKMVFPDLDVFMDFSKQTDPEQALKAISERFLSLIDRIWQLVGFPEEEGRETTVEEHLAVLREIGVLMQPYSGFRIPVPIDYKPSDKLTNFVDLPEWIQSLREAKSTMSS